MISSLSTTDSIILTNYFHLIIKKEPHNGDSVKTDTSPPWFRLHPSTETLTLKKELSSL